MTTNRIIKNKIWQILYNNSTGRSTLLESQDVNNNNGFCDILLCNEKYRSVLLCALILTKGEVRKKCEVTNYDYY